jgi:hypothetical protein
VSPSLSFLLELKLQKALSLRMTTREHINQTRRRASLFFGVGFAILVGGLVVEKGPDPQPWLIIAGVVLIIVGIVFSLLTGRCLQCHHLLGGLSRLEGSSFYRISSSLRFCPYCGHSLDAPHPGDAPIER